MYLPASEVHSESSQTSKLKLFMKIIKEWKPLTIFKKSFIIMFDWVLNAPVWFMLQCGMSVWRPSSGGSWSFFLRKYPWKRIFLLHSKNISPRVFSWDFYKISRTVFFGIHQSSKILLHWTLENAKQKLKKS